MPVMGTNWYLTVSSDQVWLSDGLQLRQLTIDAAAVSSLSGLDLSQNLYLNTPMTISDSTIGSNVFIGGSVHAAEQLCQPAVS